MNFYKCDPAKNISCTKTNCYLNGGTCEITSNPKVSVDGCPFRTDEGWSKHRIYKRKERG